MGELQQSVAVMAGDSATLAELAGENAMLRSLIYEYLETAGELQERLNATAGMPEEKRGAIGERSKRSPSSRMLTYAHVCRYGGRELEAQGVC